MIDLAYVLELLARSPHLYALTALYWAVVAWTFAQRYLLGRREASEPWLRRVVAVGLVAGAAAVVDVAVRGPELVHLSLVAYLATPLGVGRLLVRRLDGVSSTPRQALVLRETTYLVAFGMFVVLSVAAGDPWWFSPVEIDDSSAVAVIEGTDWFQVMATAWGMAAVIDLVCGVTGINGLLGVSGARRVTPAHR
ncbi:MAG: hypothetical protein Q7T56_13615 [Nocardioidaceae bacterium]|nr:hypothetical protein [Nocardioidaceae bacterium]